MSAQPSHLRLHRHHPEHAGDRLPPDFVPHNGEQVTPIEMAAFEIAVQAATRDVHRRDAARKLRLVRDGGEG